MRNVVDLVNFNADASCLSVERWFSALHGGCKSDFVRWLQLYVDRCRKMSLGMTGATLAEVSALNPEALRLINSNPDIFEIILRPFAHDIGLLRCKRGFAANFDYGQRAITKEFGRVSRYFLPPEFMLTNEQVAHLSRSNVDGIFINATRFAPEVRSRLPDSPYTVTGLYGRSITCIPVDGRLTDAYLESLHQFNARAWNRCVRESAVANIVSWRDGESPFIVPEGVAREQAWLDAEHRSIRRVHLRDGMGVLKSEIRMPYPVHSFLSWMKEFRMLGFLGRIQKCEGEFDRMKPESRRLWLMAIGSDILSSVEKAPPRVSIRRKPGSKRADVYTILRTDRGFEGEEYLGILEEFVEEGRLPMYVSESSSLHIERLRVRMRYLRELT